MIVRFVISLKLVNFKKVNSSVLCVSQLAHLQSSKGRRLGHDDIDAPSRLSLLNNPYYRDVLGEYGAFFAVANRIDRIHKNTWIGFQSWRATARQVHIIH